MSTKTEIVKYNEQDHSFISYGDNDGKTTSFNNRSFLILKNKLIFFGGIDNITYFDPNKIGENYSTPEVIFTNLRVNNTLIQYQLKKAA
jgi:hypothetical protein